MTIYQHSTPAFLVHLHSKRHQRQHNTPRSHAVARIPDPKLWMKNLDPLVSARGANNKPCDRRTGYRYQKSSFIILRRVPAMSFGQTQHSVLHTDYYKAVFQAKDRLTDLHPTAAQAHNQNSVAPALLDLRSPIVLSQLQCPWPIALRLRSTRKSKVAPQIGMPHPKQKKYSINDPLPGSPTCPQPLFISNMMSTNYITSLSANNYDFSL